MPLSPAADTKHDRPRQQAVTNGNPTGSAVARDDDLDDSPSGNTIVVRIGIPDLQQTVTHTHRYTQCYSQVHKYWDTNYDHFYSQTHSFKGSKVIGRFAATLHHDLRFAFVVNLNKT